MIPAMSDQPPRQQLLQLARALEGDTTVIEPTVTRIWAEIPSYGAASREQLEASVRRNLRLSARAVLTGQVPPPAEIWEAEQGTVERLRVGIPIVDVMAGFRVSISSIEDRLIDLAADLEIPSQEVIALTRLLRQLGDAFSARAASAYRQEGVAVAVAEQRRRDRWLVELLNGQQDPGELEPGVTFYGLSRGRAYTPFVSAARNAAALEELQDTLARRTRGAGTAMMLPSDDQLIGLLPATPEPVPGHLLALGHPVHLEDVAASYALARRVLAAAVIGAPEGVHTLEGLGWRIGVPAVPELAALVRDRYLAPLRGAGAFGAEVEVVLRAYLANARSIPRTAAATHAHVNTVRYRLSRFEELTGRDLAQTDTLIELSWALQLA